MFMINNPGNKAAADDEPACAGSRPQTGWVKGAEYVLTQKGKRFILGSQSGTFDEKPRNARQPGRNSHRHDWAGDIAQMGDMLAMGASLRGAMHYGFCTIRQDSYAIGSENNTNECKWIIAAIADGVSSAEQAHAFADYMARQAVITAGEELSAATPAKLRDVDWKALAQRLVAVSDDFCRFAARRIVPEEKTAQIARAMPMDFAQKWATTLELAVVAANCDKPSSGNEYAHLTVAGDGAAYVLNKKQGWNTIKPGKRQSKNIATNAVFSLPLHPREFPLTYGCLGRYDCLVLATDGLSDFIGDGGTQLGGFFQDRLPGCASLASFMQIADVSMFQADDDRTIVMIKRG